MFLVLQSMRSRIALHSPDVFKDCASRNPVLETPSPHVEREGVFLLAVGVGSIMTF